MLKKITVGVDGSQNSLFAFECALDIAKKLNAQVSCIFVLDIRKTALPYMYTGNSMDYPFERTFIPANVDFIDVFKQVAADLRTFGSQILLKCRKMAGKRGIALETAVLEGYPSEVLCEESKSGGLLIVGEHGESGNVSKAVVGSTTEDIVHRSPRPVLVCPDKPCTLDTLLFPYDGSRSAENAMQFLANVFQSVFSRVTLAAINEEEEQNRSIDDELQYLGSHGVDYSLQYEKGSPIAVITKMAESFDMILVGAKGRNKLVDLILGSTTIHLIRKCPKPVLIVY